MTTAQKAAAKIIAGLTAQRSTFGASLGRRAGNERPRMTYTVAAINSDNRVVCAKAAHEREARKTARTWRKDTTLRSVQIISRDEYGRGRIEDQR